MNRDASTAEVEVEAGKLVEQLREAQAGGSGVKNVRIEVRDSDNARHIEIVLPVGALRESGQGHFIEVATEHGTVKLPIDYLSGTAIAPGDTVTLRVSQADAMAMTNDWQAAVGDRPVVTVELLDRNNEPVRGAFGDNLQLSIPYELTEEEADSTHMLVLVRIDVQGNIAVVPSARYARDDATVRGMMDRSGTYAVVRMERADFADVDGDGWAELSIEALAARGVINGIGEGFYGPDRPITRADFVTMLVRMLGLQGSAANDGFSDVDEAAYYYEALGIAQELGLIQGQGDGRFRPDGTITRQDMFTIVSRAGSMLGLLQTEETDPEKLDAFRDSDRVAGYARESVARLITLGLVEGNGNQVRPEANATRSETAVFLYRILNKMYE